MIKATFVKNNGLLNGFEVSGHADSGDYGHDIVCAAVSALVICTANALKTVTHIDPKIDQDEKKRRLYFSENC